MFLKENNCEDSSQSISIQLVIKTEEWRSGATVTMCKEQEVPERPTLTWPLDKRQSPAAEGRMSFPAKSTKTTRYLHGEKKKRKLDPFHRPHTQSA